MRGLAEVLGCDDLWLATGRTPVKEAAPVVTAPQIRGAVLAVAGLIEMVGGRVVFSDPGLNKASLSVNLGQGQIDVLVVVPQETEDNGLSVVVPEPTSNARIIAIVANSNLKTGAAVRLFDLTTAHRERRGGYSILIVSPEQAKAVQMNSILALAASKREG